MESDLILRNSGIRLTLGDGVDNRAFEVSDDYSLPPSEAGSEGNLIDNWPSDQETHGDICDSLSTVTSYAALHDSVAESEEPNSRLRDFDDVDGAGQIGEWDVFEETPWENFSHADRNFWSRVHVISRVVFCIFLFFFITFTSSVSVLGFLIIAFNMDRASKTSGLSSLQQEADSSGFNVRWVWAAILLASAPHAFTFCRCMMRLSLKRTRSLTWRPLLLAVTIETLHSVGLNIFLFMVAPSYDPLLVLMLSQAQTLVPASLRIYRGQKQKGQETEELRVSFKNALEFLLSLGFLVILGYKLSSKTNTVIGLAGPVAMALVSVVYWDNFIPVLESWKIGRRDEMRYMRKNKLKVEFTSGSILFRAKHAIKDRRTKIDAVCSVWKIFLNLLLPLILLAARGGTQCVSTLFLASDSAVGCVLWADDLGLDGTGDSGDWCKTYLPFAVAGICILASVAAYKAAQVSCKINAQQPCFSLPLLLTVPITFIISLTTYRTPLSLFDCSVLWPKLSPGSSLLDLLKEYTSEYWLPAMLVGFLQLALISAHVWTPTAERVASTDKLFLRPMYCGILFVQSMLYSRAVDDHELPSATTTEKKNKADSEDWTTRLQSMTFDAETEDEIVKQMNSARFPRIYACATMWHETAREMTQLLKSLFRMDSDQFLKSCMWKRFNIVHKDFYHYEAHIFFDDAFKKINNDENCYRDSDFAVNDYVIQFCSVVEEASESVYPPGMSISAPEKIVTPYGGRLVYELPGGNPLVVHLKNRFFIRHKKRWSQVMYMYYLLSYKLLLGNSSRSEKVKLADNTFLLTLDGDVDFHPDAVQLLVDRMKRNSNVGAACGRIHPVGSGLMVWYQKFEYAVSHWLQKAAEHVFGCVLCSPGCFSLFRGSALMADNVLKRYSKTATTARHAVQYDMGEDRWLCTLLLQGGKRVEYAAAADALTFCPDDFGEFFTQRRRWTPSTMANILDLLSDWRHVTKINSSVSFAFIFYQTFLFISSVLTPGTIFLLIFGAINTAYPSMPLYGAMLVNFAPIFVFIVLCFVARTEVQIAYATILSTAYSLVMMIVLVGLLRQIQESGLCSVTAIFFLGIAVIFVITALLHPQEMGNIFFGILYFLAIPCTSMILVFYAVANLNVVAWGTRDSNTPSGGQKKSLSERLGLQRVKQVVGGGAEKEVEKTVTSHYTFSFGNLFRCICCPLEKTDDTAARFSDLENALYDLKRAVLEQKGPHHGNDNNDRRGQTVTEEPVRPSVRFDVGPQDTAQPPDGKDTLDGGRQPNSGLFPPDCWWQEEALGLGIVKYLAPDEYSFWSQLIEKYLKPLQTSPEDQEQMAKDLTMLRNKAAMLFFLGNALFVTIIFILESVAEYSPGLTIQLPCDQGHVGQKIEPISVVFTVIFGILLCLQFIAMLIHRLSTLVHIIASTGFKKENTGNERDNFNKFGFYDLTRDIVYGELLQRETGASISESDITPTVTRTSTDGEDTATEISFHPVEVLIKRQLTRGRSLKKTELQKVFDKRVTTVIEGIENVGESSDSPDGEEASDGQTKDKDKDKDEQQVHEAVQRRLPWLRRHSVKAAATLLKNKAMKEVVVQRTERAQKRWKDAMDKVRRPAAMVDLVGKVLQRNHAAEVLRAGTSAEGEEKHTPLQGVETSTTLQMTPPTTLQMTPPTTLQSVTVTNESTKETGHKVLRSKAVKGKAPPPPPPQGSARAEGLSNTDSVTKDTPESKQTPAPMKSTPQPSSKDNNGTEDTPIKPTPGAAGSTAERGGLQTVASKPKSALKKASKANDTPVTAGAAVERARDADATIAAGKPRSAPRNTTKADGTPVADATARYQDSTITARKAGPTSKKVSVTDYAPPTSAASPGTTSGNDATTTASAVTPSRNASDTQSSAAAAEKPAGPGPRVEKKMARKPVEASAAATAAASVATASTDGEKGQEAPLAVASKTSTGSARSEAHESKGEVTETRF